ncbi:hypothetical protein COL516b_007177 [Colletotrichum fioriniae]|nr:uncharacterized protein COL516b_007177 [Colletotrichum fioriniae]KAJ0302637.1 hypothetical protein COL516b_007177 [Colletotrichum fioriniae]
MTKVFVGLRLLHWQHLHSAAENTALCRHNSVNLLHGVRVRQRDVIHLKHDPILGRQLRLLRQDVSRHLVRGPKDRLPVQRAVPLVLFFCRFQCAVQQRRDPASALAEVDVTRAQREAVVRARRLADDDVHGEHEVFHHAADNDRLLNVLLAKVYALRLHNIEQLHAHRRDAPEESRSARALEDLPHRRNRHKAPFTPDLLPGEARGIHLPRRRRKHSAHAAEHIPVARQLAVQVPQDFGVARPGYRVLCDAELGRVDVDGDDDMVVLAGGGADEGEVALVEGTHCRDEAYGAVV